MDTLLRDLRYGFRGLLKRPAFTVIAVIALALGIGANTAIFSLVNAVLLRPLPFADPDRLVWMWGNIRNGGSHASTSPMDFLDYRQQNTSFEQFAAFFSIPQHLNLTGNGEPQRLSTSGVTGNYFQALGVKPLLGRTFVIENEKSGNDQVVVLSYGLWQERFGGDQTIVNRTIVLDGQSYAVLGVMPKEFNFPQDTEIWVPMNFDRSPGMKLRTAHFLRAIGKLKPGVTLAQAQADTDAVAHRLEEQFPVTNKGWNLRLVSLREQLIGDTKPTLLILLGAVAFVLLIGCANVANLLLVRAAERQKEMALRTALGARRFRIAKQVITESMLLALLGGGLGTVLASWGLNLLVLSSANSLPPTAQVKIDLNVLAFTLLVSLGTGFVFGAAPALRTMKVNLSDALKEGGRSGDGARHNKTRSLLVVLESALAVLLLIGAGLLVRSLIRLQNVRPGFDANQVLTMRLDLPEQKYPTPEKMSSFFGQLESRVGALPGVENVGLISELPMSGQPNDIPYGVEGRLAQSPADYYDSDFRSVNRQYFAALRIPLLRGRNFTDQEVRDSAKVVIISELLAQEVFPNEEPIGKRLLPGIGGKEAFEIIGVVGDIRHRALADEPISALYFPSYAGSWMNVVIRASGDPTNLTTAVRTEVRAIDPDQPIAAVKTMNEWLAASAATERFRTSLLGLFALIALLLAATGIYGVMSYTVTQRTHEIGIRMALGASQFDVVKSIMGQGLALVCSGVVLGVVGAIGVTRVLSSLLFGINARDPLTFVVVAVGLPLVALVACYIPARRATKVDPLVALRYQ